MSLRLTLATCVALVCTTLASTPATAQAIIPGFNGATWYPAFSSTYGLQISEATLARVGGGTHYDGYDGGWRIRVNGNRLGGGAIDLTGTTLTAGPVAVSGLDVTVQHYYSPASSLARILVTLRNPGATAVAATVSVPINLGSDQDTLINATSSGDTSVSSADRWVVSSDPYGPSDPVITSVFFGPGSPAVTPVSLAHTGPEFDDLNASFELTVPAGTTRSLMFFAGLGGVITADNTVASALAAAGLFNATTTLREDWLSGLSATEQSQIANWAFFTSCAAEGYGGAKLTLCRQVCEIDQTPTRLLSLIKLYTAIYREDPPCAR